MHCEIHCTDLATVCVVPEIRFFTFLMNQIWQFAVSTQSQVCPTCFFSWQVTKILFQPLEAAWIYSSSMTFWGRNPKEKNGCFDC